MALSDTSKKASEFYFQRLHEMTPAERVGLGVSLWETGHSLQRAGTRRKYPDADDEEIAFRMAVSRFGEEMARKAYGKA